MKEQKSSKSGSDKTKTSKSTQSASGSSGSGGGNTYQSSYTYESGQEQSSESSGQKLSSGSSGQSQSSGSGYTYEQSYSSGQQIQQEISVSYGSIYGPKDSAVAACKQSGMELAVISEKMIQDMIAKAFRNKYEGDVWINSKSKHETWTWWANDKGSGDCLIMSEKDDYKWRQAPCTAEIAFFACMSKGPETVVNGK
ncbi:lysozyme D-like [Acanthaster planci]|uniref:Lysozyme D-like n=1 Tax=Acanthaster planci TaxID=133434 RepID=A0A8B7ZFL8_ACAPL|nr:lysozyme D-like [Acanthaster planci]